MRKILFQMLLIFCCIQMYAQDIHIEVNIEDGFLKIPLSGVKVSILDTNHMVVVDSAQNTSFKDRNGKSVLENYIASVKAEKRNYLLRATKPGYDDVEVPVSVSSLDIKTVNVPTIKMRKMRTASIDEVVVKATKVKMFYKGDTLVYNADAFKLPDGSMLDALIRQLPGVTLDKNGQIFVNGRRVDEMLLGSRSFMRGNKKVLMENLPYYTVKDLKVYEKQSDKSMALGYDIEPRSYVMDVNLKNEYQIGYIANVEAAGGTEDRWLGRGFLLGFTDRWRYTLLANANNVNESRHIGEQGHWSPTNMSQSLLTTRSVATDLDYQSKDKNMKNNFNADFTSSSTSLEMSQRYEQFLDGSKPVSLTNSLNHSGNRHLKLNNDFVLKKPIYLALRSHFDYEKRDGSGWTNFEQRNDTLTASMRTNALSEGRLWSLCQEIDGIFNINKEKQWNWGYYIVFKHDDDQSWLSSRYDTWQAATRLNDIRHNANDFSNKTTRLLLAPVLNFRELLGKLSLSISDDFNFYNNRTHDYLYHPDTLLLASQLDMLTAITDLSNSYNSHQQDVNNFLTVAFYKRAYYKMSFYNIVYDRWRVSLKFPMIHQSLDYQRGAIDTLARASHLYFTPSASYRHVSQNGNHDFRINASYNCTPAELLNQIAYRDDSNPLVIKEGNPDLKGKQTTSANIDYTEKAWKNIGQWHVGAAFNYTHRDVAQSVAYNSSTGVYTYKPMNISGAYSAKIRFDISSSIGKKSYWSWQMNGDANYNHSIDHSMLIGETESHENTVNTTLLHDNAYIQFNKDEFNIRMSGDISWRHSEGKMRDFTTLNALDFNYGMSARYTIPHINTTLSADATMYSRRGYGSKELNTNNFVLNASLSQSFWKGKLIAKVEAFDLLHQVSSTQYYVNAQGRTETWFRSLPHYVMMHLVYHWNKNPKKP